MSYRIYLDHDDKITVIQWDWDYDIDRCLDGDYGGKKEFDYQSDAIEYVNKNFQREFIDAEILAPAHQDFFKNARKQKDDDSDW